MGPALYSQKGSTVNDKGPPSISPLGHLAERVPWCLLDHSWYGVANTHLQMLRGWDRVPHIESLSHKIFSSLKVSRDSLLLFIAASQAAEFGIPTHHAACKACHPSKNLTQKSRAQHQVLEETNQPSKMSVRSMRYQLRRSVFRSQATDYMSLSIHEIQREMFTVKENFKLCIQQCTRWTTPAFKDITECFWIKRFVKEMLIKRKAWTDILPSIPPLEENTNQGGLNGYLPNPTELRLQFAKNVEANTNVF